MALPITAQKNSLATKYSTDCVYACLFTAAPATTGAATNEVVGTVYSRVALTWGAVASGVITGTATLNVPSGVTVTHIGVTTGATKTTADVRDTADVTDQPFNSDGTYALTLTFTIS